MRRRRLVLLAVVVAILAGACDPDIRTEGPLVQFPSESPTAPATAAPSGAPGSPPSDGTAAPGDPDAPTPDDGGPAQPDQPADGGQSDETGQSDAGGGEPAQDQQAPGGPTQALTELADGGPVGANAAAYLRGDRQTVVFEVDSQSALSDATLGHVRSILERESNSAVELTLGAVADGARDTWTTEQVRAAAAASRDRAQGEDQAVLHLLVLDGQPEQDGVLGYAFDSSTAVVFPDQWASLTGALLSGDRVARAVTTHEVGHLLGLVGLYEEPVDDHEDPEHPGHTTERDDVMYWAIESDAIAQLAGSVPTDFTDVTRADLAAIREG